MITLTIRYWFFLFWQNSKVCVTTWRCSVWLQWYYVVFWCVQSWQYVDVKIQIKFNIFGLLASLLTTQEIFLRVPWGLCEMFVHFWRILNKDLKHQSLHCDKYIYWHGFHLLGCCELTFEVILPFYSAIKQFVEYSYNETTMHFRLSENFDILVLKSWTTWTTNTHNWSNIVCRCIKL